MTNTEVWLSAALALVVTACGISLSYMTQQHQTMREQRRRARNAARARSRRERGVTVRPRG
jgi:heme exporter protein D